MGRILSNVLSVVVTTPPNLTLTYTAYSFIKAAIESDVKIVGVFFYQDGVLNANSLLDIPTDEFDARPLWCSLSKEANVPLHLCVTAAEKRGVIDGKNVLEEFTVSGLGELVSLTNDSSKLVQF